MAEGKQQARTGFLSSKYWRMLLVLIMGVLLFGAPYLVYVFIEVLKVRFLISTLVGFAAVFVGLLLLWYLIKKKVIT
jgi:lipid-A-disaccharide synthase-like uncharacterized protein